jgi:GDPmannose 4,6-dehydratase
VSSCLYSITKNATADLIDYYRKNYGVACSNAYLFNHESEFRSPSFFIPKILDCLARTLRDRSTVAEVYTLDFYCDWGSAEEYMDLLIEIGLRCPGEDFVVGTGVCTYARDLVEKIFERFSLDYSCHVAERRVTGHSMLKPYKVDNQKLQRLLGRAPVESIAAVCGRILRVNHGLEQDVQG